MKKLFVAWLALIVLGVGVCIVVWKMGHSSGPDSQVAALRALRDSGVITAQEYDSRMAALRTGDSAAAALKQLRDSGVITGQEYQQKLQTLQPGGVASSPVAASPIVQTASAAVPPAANASSPGGTRDEQVTDPTLNNMVAYTVIIPAKWHFQGAQFQGGKCSPMPFRVWRATSPDGLSFMERMPVFGWAWGTGPMAEHMPEGCLPLHGSMSAQDFLKHVAAMLQVEYVSDQPQPASLNASLQKELRDADASVAGSYTSRGATPPKTSVEAAAANVRYRNGTFVMNGRMWVQVSCNETSYPGTKSVAPYTPGRPIGLVTGPPSMLGQCTAGLNYVVAPENQFAEVMQQWQAPGMMGHSNEAWENAWTQRSQQRIQQFTAAMNQQAAAQRQAQQQQFNHEQAVRQQMHEQFLTTLQAGTNRSMARTQDAMNARSTAASDWVDYALDRKTVMDPGTGQVTKVSSSYSYTWMDNTGHSYQTNDVNANPNGALSGNWTQQQVVHGDGKQY